MKKGLHSYIFVVALIFMSTWVSAQESKTLNWEQFRGPNRDGIVKDAIKSGKMKKNWTKKLGEGFSEVIVSGNKLYTMFAEKTDSLNGWELIGAFDANTGKEIWSQKVDSIYIDVDGFGDGPRSTPIIDENTIYSLSSHGILSAHSLKNGKLLWKFSFIEKFGSKRPRWAFSTSPLLIDDVLVVEAMGKDNHAIIGVNVKNGEVVWSKLNGAESYCSPAFAKLNGQECVVFANKRTLSALTTKGDTLWTWQMPISGPTAMPMVFDGNKIFISTLRMGYIVAEVIDNEPKLLHKGMTMKNDYSSSVYHDGYIYGFNVATLQCISAETGEKKWSKRGFGKGSLIMVGDKLIVFSDKGKLAIAKASPDKYTELSNTQALTGKSWTAPSYANGRLYIRNVNEMGCYSID